MAFHKFFRAILAGKPIAVYGDGNQTRDFTYVGDIAAATMAAGLTFSWASCRIINVGAGRSTPLNQVFGCLAEITGTEPLIEYRPDERGDMRDTLADITLARELLGFAPRVGLEEGLARQHAWMTANRHLLDG
jgi:UDP-glucose 4-epimerase